MALEKKPTSLFVVIGNGFDECSVFFIF